MTEDDKPDPNDPNTLTVPFIFVRHGDPWPTEWLREHPGAVRIPATFVPRPPDPAEQRALAVRPGNIPGRFAPVRSASAWPVDRHGRPWPRTAFGLSQCPLSELPAGMRAPGEAIPPEDCLDGFDPTKFDPIRAFLALKPVLDDPASAAGIVRAATDERATPDAKDASDNPANFTDLPGVLANALGKIAEWLNPIGTANATEFQTRTGSAFSIPDSDAVAKLARNAFATAIPSGSALRKTTPSSPQYDPYAAAAANPLVFQEALRSGQIFVTPSGRLPGSLLLQVEGSVQGTKGIYE